MSFLGLPSEIIDAIIDLGLPSGIEGLALTCKAIYGRAKTQIERHNTLKRQWRYTNNYGAGRLYDTLGIIYAVSQDPLIAKYIEALDLWDERGNDEEDPDVLDFRGDHNAMERLREFVVALPFLDEIDTDAEKWWEAMMHEEATRIGDDNMEGACTIVTLLSLLPNLKTLRLDSGWRDLEDTAEYKIGHEGLAAIVKMATLTEGPRERPLSKLKVLLPFMHAGYDEKAALQLVKPFLETGSIEEVYLISAIAVDDGYTGSPFVWRTPSLAPNLTRIELASCCIDGDGIGELVRHTPSLTVFKYSHETKWHGCEHDWNAGLFVEALARHCGTTLIELALTIDELFGDVINGVSSLLSFSRLEKLEVDVGVFRGPPVESGQRLGLDTNIPDGLPEGQQAWTDDDIPCIGSMLPDSIVEAQINTEFPDPDEQALASVLKNLRPQRLERLHRMERCIVRQYNAESARVYAEKVGATLETFDLHLENPRIRRSMPAWKREFHERIDKLRGGEHAPYE